MPHNIVESIKNDLSVPINSFISQTQLSKSKVKKILINITSGENPIGEYHVVEEVFIKKSVDLEFTEEGFSNYMAGIAEKTKKRKRD